MIRFLFFIAYLLGLIFRVFRKLPNSALVMPTTIPESVGDETMATVVVERVRAKGYSAIGLTCHKSEGEWQYIDPTACCSPPLLSLIAHPLRNVFAIAGALFFLSQYESAFCNPGDTLDGHYDRGKRSALSLLLILYFIASSGTAVHVMGFSVNKHPTNRSLRALRIAASRMRLCARDARTWQRLKDAGITNVVKVADVAFLLDPAPGAIIQKTPWEFIRSHRANGGTILGLNPHFLSFKTTEQKEWLYNFLHRTCVELLHDDRSLAIVLLPHDRRPYRDGTDNGFVIADRLMKMFSAEHAERVTNLVASFGISREIRLICSQLDYCVAGSMHLAIASLSQGVPTMSFGYQDKFEGLYDFFHVRTAPLLDINLLHLTESCAPQVREFMASASLLREEIRAHLPSVLALAQRNFND